MFIDEEDKLNTEEKNSVEDPANAALFDDFLPSEKKRPSHPWTIIYTTYSLLDKWGVTISHLKECRLKIEPEFVNPMTFSFAVPEQI